jgi:hypothetical protein
MPPQAVTIKVEDIKDAIAMGTPAPHVELAQNVVSQNGTVTFTSYGEVVGVFNDLGELNRFIVNSIASGNTDSIRTNYIMTMEVVNLVADMISGSPANITFTVGGMKEEYRRLLKKEIQRANWLLFEDTDAYISFGYSRDNICRIDYM